MSYAEQMDLVQDFLAMLREKFRNKSFGYESFPDLDYERMALSTIFAILKDQGHIKTVGMMEFKLVSQESEQEVDSFDKKVMELVNKLEPRRTALRYDSTVDEIVALGERAIPVLVKNIRKNGWIPFILAKIGGKSVLKPLMSLATSKGTFDSDPVGQYQWYAAECAIHALGVLGDEDALMFLYKIYNETSIAELMHAAYDSIERIEFKHSSIKLPDSLSNKSLSELKDIAKNHETNPEILRVLSCHPAYSVRSLVALNPNTPPDILRQMAKIMGQPGCQLSKLNVHYQLAQNPNCPPDVLDFIIQHGDEFAVMKAKENPNYGKYKREDEAQINIEERQQDIEISRTSDIHTTAFIFDLPEPVEPRTQKLKQFIQRHHKGFIAAIFIIAGAVLLYPLISLIVWFIDQDLYNSIFNPTFLFSLNFLEMDIIALVYMGIYGLFLITIGLNILSKKVDDKYSECGFCICCVNMLFLIVVAYVSFSGYLMFAAIGVALLIISFIVGPDK